MSVSPTSTSGSYPLPTSSQQPIFNPSTPAPPYSAMPSADELTLPSQPGSLPPYSSQPGSSNAPIPLGAPDRTAAPAPKTGMGMGGLILAAVAGIPGYFAGKNVLRSYPVIGGMLGAAVAAIAGFVGWAFLSQKQPNA